MSWSVSAMGKGEAVARDLQNQFNRIAKMDAPEDAMCRKACEILLTACRSAPKSGFVTHAEGSQWKASDGPDRDKIKGLHFKIVIDMQAFLE